MTTPLSTECCWRKDLFTLGLKAVVCIPLSLDPPFFHYSCLLTFYTQRNHYLPLLTSHLQEGQTVCRGESKTTVVWKGRVW